MSQEKMCFPRCRFFKCGNNSLLYRGPIVWCKWTDEKCDIPHCSYALCVKRKLLPKGICGETVKRKTREKAPEETIGPSIKLRGKALRKLGEKEIF